MKTLDVREKAELLRQLGHPTRLAILKELLGGVKCVTDIRDLLDVPQPNISQHLAVLRQYQVVDYYEDGLLRCYYLRRPSLVKALFRFLSGEYPTVRRSRSVVRREGEKREMRATGRVACHVG